MKTDIEEPVRKSWKLFLFLLLILIILLGTGILLIIWYMENLKNPDIKTDTSRVVVSGIGVLLLIVTLIISLINLYSPGKKKSKGTSKGLGNMVSKKSFSSSMRKPVSHKRVRK